jgi:hypothetical protein
MSNHSPRDKRLIVSRRSRHAPHRSDRHHDQLHAANGPSLELKTAGEPLSLCATEGDSTLPSFTAIAYTGGVMHPKLAIAWNGPVVIDLAGMAISQVNPIHRDHAEGKPIGHSTAVDNTGTRLVCSGVFSVSNEDTSEIIESSKKGFPWRPSVGVKIEAYTTLTAGQRAVINGREFVGPLLWVKRSTLKEISLVTIPGDDSATIQIAASLSSKTPAAMPTFEEYCTSLGLDPATLTPEAVEALKIAYAESMEPPEVAASDSAETPATPAAKPMEKPMPATASSPIDLAASLSDFRAQLASETNRVNKVRDLCSKFGNPAVMIAGKTVDLAAHAIAEGWTDEQTELAARRHKDLEDAREARPRGPAIHSQSRAASLDALQAGMLLRAGCSLDSESFSNPWVKQKLPQWLRAGINDPARQRAMDAGHSVADLSLVDACRLGLQARGVDVPASRLDMIQASFSSGTAAVLFGATIGAKMLESYAEVEDFSAGWCSEEENPDLEQHNRNRMVSAQNLGYHPPGGEAPHASRSVVTEKAQVNRFSRQLKIDEADVLGDNFGKFKDTPKDFGQAAGRVRPDMVATVLLSNPNLLQTSRALFNTTDGNMVASGKALARATLSEMIAAIRKRRDGEASMNLSPDFLIVPPDLFDTALQLCYSVVLSNDSGAGEINPIKAYGIKPISEPRLANGMVHPITGANLAGSTTQYYGVASKGRTIEVTYLQGAGRTPVVRTDNLTGGEFGIVIDVRHYVGATALDWRSMHRLSA